MKQTSIKKISVIENTIPVEHDISLAIAYGKSRFEKEWKNRRINWSGLIGRLSGSQKTAETHAEYMKMTKADQDRIKDIGGFVGGHLTGGRRSAGTVACRQILTLDLDYPPEDLWGGLMDNFSLDCAMAVYSTHKHSPGRPRYRLIMPLDREATPEEYEAVARKVGEKVGIDYFDDSTFQPSRLMFWPSHSADVEPYFNYYDAGALSADQVLAEYPDWTDVSYWPMTSREKSIRRKAMEKQQNPLDKGNIVGLFCRTYSITEAIEKFLPEVYVETAKPDRYTYTGGSTAAGLVIYDDLFAYSNHSTDPASMQDCNAFDLVRIHRFGNLDEDSAGSGKNLPSYKAMAEFAAKDPEVRSRQSDESAEQAKVEFAPLEENEDWRQRLTRDKNGCIVPDATNALLIMTFDEHLQGVRLNEMSGRLEGEGLPWDRPGRHWRDDDDAQLYLWIAKEHKVQFPDVKFFKALRVAADNRRYHPIRDYLKALPAWDGVERVDRLLVDYLGAEDNVYVMQATRKALTAAAARIFEPGIKFDYVLVLVGPQGVGKSTFFSRLSGEWFSDALTLTDMKDKTGAELVQGHWIIELGEMAGMRKADVECVKGFVSRQIDTYRPAYGRNVESHPRQCVIVGSTNAEGGFLRDVTGNRRFWPVNITGEGAKRPWDLDQDTVDQIWAEVLEIYGAGEDLFLSGEAEALASAAQRGAMEADERMGMVQEYLDTPLPENWDSMDIDSRLLHLSDGEGGSVERVTVSNAEIWTECFGKRRADMQPKDSYAISAIMAKIDGWRQCGQKRLPFYGKQRIYRKWNRNNWNNNSMEVKKR